MSFLQSLLNYKKICIQCHNNPDADTVASAFGVYSYLKSRDIDASIVYGGDYIIKKYSLNIMIDECNIPILHTHNPGDFDLLLMVDCQYGGGNAEIFEAKNVAVIDHHTTHCTPPKLHLIESTCQSCSTLVWELLCQEGFFVDELLSSALLFGLYTDTSLFADLYARRDTEMKMELYKGQPLFERIAKSNMTYAELLVASEAIQNNNLNMENNFAIVEAVTCEQSILGTIGDFVIQADIIYLSFTYTLSGDDYRISLRSCTEELQANLIAQFLCNGTGSGGGHKNKAGGYINKTKFEEKYGKGPFSEIIEDLICKYISRGR